MREIKFRAWNGNNMLYWEDIKKYGIQIFDIFDISFYKNGNRLMQYTGLTDKNGKEIYEGDIVKYEPDGVEEPALFKKENCVIEYFEDRFLAIRNIGKPYPIFKKSCIEVIGNIYENKEFL